LPAVFLILRETRSNTSSRTRAAIRRNPDPRRREERLAIAFLHSSYSKLIRPLRPYGLSLHSSWVCPQSLQLQRKWPPPCRCSPTPHHRLRGPARRAAVIV